MSTGSEAIGAVCADRQITVGGHPTRVWRGGDGPALLLLHGAGPGVDAEENWASLLPRLSTRFDCIAPDLLGFGEGAVAPAPVPHGRRAWAEARATQVVALLEALEIEAAHVIGNSAGGGATALALLALAPERLDRVVIMGGGGYGAPLAGAPVVDYYDAPSVASMRTLIEAMVADPARSGIAFEEVARRRHNRADRPGAAELYRAMSAADDEVVIPPPAGSVPVLLVHGAEDRVFAVERSVRLREALVTSHLHVLPAAGHWVQVDRPAAFCHLVEDFLLGDPELADCGHRS